MQMKSLDKPEIQKAKSRWPKLSDEDLRTNDSDRLIDVVQRKCGLARPEAERQVNEFLESCGCETGTSQSKSASPMGKSGTSGSGSTSSSGSSPGGDRGQGQRSNPSQRPSQSSSGSREESEEREERDEDNS